MKSSLTASSDGKQSLRRLLSVVTAVALTVAFLKESGTNIMTWLDYIGYATGMAICYSPVLAGKAIDMMGKKKK